ncbi:ALP1-like protein isoform X1 [Tanacetum coccineum]|uniref:ALP1-like protein isoform X1 n=1 Tax=Tanacetum coccineum TaxID=301880 RepID=A0ABQ5AJE7_9ASTR
MMSDSSGGDLSDIDDFDDLEMIMQQVQAEQEEEEEAERVRHRNYIYRERIEAEERLKADYFGPNPKYPLYYFRKRYRMSRELFLEIVSGIENYIQTHHPLPPHFDFFRVRPDATGLPEKNALFKCNGVTFEKESARKDVEKGYYLAEDIYPQWSSFVKSFTVANSEKNALFKWKQESARKDVEIAFGVLQGHWHIICQPARAWTVNKCVLGLSTSYAESCTLALYCIT